MQNAYEFEAFVAKHKRFNYHGQFNYLGTLGLRCIHRIYESFEKLDREVVEEMRTRMLLKLFMTIAILLLAIPVTTSAQYQRSYDRYDREDRGDRRDVRQAINQLDSSSARLQNDLNASSRSRRVLGGLFLVRNADSTAVSELDNFRQALRELRRDFRDDRSLDSTRDEARAVINRGIQLDRYLRLRTGSTSVDAELANIRSNLHLLAEAYDLNLRY